MGSISRNVLIRLIEALIKEESLETVSQIVSSDPNLTAKILTFVNSAYCGLRREIHSVKNAVAYIGYRKLKEIAFSLLLTAVLKNVSKEEILKIVQMAYLMKALARRTFSELEDEAFLVGILNHVYIEEGEALIEKLRQVCVSRAVIEGLRNSSSPLGKLKILAEELFPWCERILNGEKLQELSIEGVKREILVGSCLESQEETQRLAEIL